MNSPKKLVPTTKMSPTPFQGVLALEEGEGEGIEFQARPPFGNFGQHVDPNGDDRGQTLPDPTLANTSLNPQTSVVRSRKTGTSANVCTSATRDATNKRHHKRRSARRKNGDATSPSSSSTSSPSKSSFGLRFVRLSTLTSCMGLLARLLFWSSAVAFVGAVGWYSYELQQLGCVFLQISMGNRTNLLYSLKSLLLVCL